MTIEKFKKRKKLPYGEYVERIVSRKKKSSKRQPKEVYDERSSDI